MGGVVGDVVGGVTSAFGGGGNAQKGWDKGLRQQDPMSQYRGFFADELFKLYQDPSKLTTMPGYQFGLEQGSENLQRSAAARGMLYSGNTFAGLQTYGQDYASQQFGNWINMLKGLATGNPGLVEGTAGAYMTGKQQRMAGIGQITGSVFGNGSSLLSGGGDGGGLMSGLEDLLPAIMSLMVGA